MTREEFKKQLRALLRKQRGIAEMAETVADVTQELSRAAGDINTVLNQAGTTIRNILNSINRLSPEARQALIQEPTVGEAAELKDRIRSALSEIVGILAQVAETVGTDLRDLM